MTDPDPYIVEADCPDCDKGLVSIVWPPGNPDTLDVDCHFCDAAVTVTRDGEVSKR